MKNPLVRLTTAVAVGLSPLLAAAQAPAPEHTLTGNMTLTSDYRFRGISQSFRLPAIQGGIDYGHASGFYLGNWNSSVSGNQYPNGASLEMDFYGGYKWEVSPGIVLDFGTIYYYYPGASYPGLPDSKYDHWEIYAGVGAGPFSAKLYYGLTDFFGLDGITGTEESKGSMYVDLGYSLELMPRTNLVAHVGYQYIPNYSNLDYWDYKLGVTYDWSGWILGASVIGTNADKSIYVATSGSGKTKNIGETGFILSIGKTF
jgi:uncharacterized protein (TIGR02001 family)